VRGLSAMRPAMSWQGTLLLRPLLGVSRAALEQYAQVHDVSYCEDPTNLDTRFDRNFLRREVLPRIRERWPAAAATVSRSAALLAEARELLERQARLDLAPVRDGAALRVSGLMCLPEVRRRNALRQWIDERGLPPPDHRRLRELATRMLSARTDALPSVRWRGADVRRHGDRLLAVDGTAGVASAAAPSVDGGGPVRWEWRRQSWLALGGGARLGIVRDPHGDVRLSALPDPLLVSFRRGGERVRGAAGRVPLKQLLQAHGLPPWLRAAVPLLGDGRQIIAIADIWLDPALHVPADGSRVLARDRGRFRWHAPAH
ncbi:MAG TPA: tRNA lysidine(34) synthetase TilS, partial [Steroidobacteraceae bacterium]|nr:tRNA lysidine(34) synthetase TilS [Steroidobacteraceae bacterium]